MYSKIPRNFYERDDVVQISKDIIGKVLCTKFNGVLTTGMITETEAYNGRNDRACHAYPNVRTKRTETIYGPPGYAYVYLCYGIHHLFNIVTNRENLADAILIRAIKPLDGVEEMLKRRDNEKVNPALSNGPGKLTQALGITTKCDKADLLGNKIWIEDREYEFDESEIKSSKRIGVEYAGEDSDLPWRFTVRGSRWVSKK